MKYESLRSFGYYMMSTMVIALFFAALAFKLSIAFAEDSFEKNAKELYRDEIRQKAESARYDELIGSLETASEAIRKREIELASKEKLIQQQQLDLAQQIKDLEEAEVRLRSTLGIANKAFEADIAKLVGMYEKMNSVDSARLFEAMDPQLASGFISQMTPAASAEILSLMQTETAYAITAIIAGRNAP